MNGVGRVTKSRLWREGKWKEVVVVLQGAETASVTQRGNTIELRALEN